MCSSEYGLIKCSCIMSAFKESTIPHSDGIASLCILLKRQSIGERPDCTILLTSVPGTKIPFVAYKDMKWQHNRWTGDGTLKIRFKRPAVFRLITASMLFTFNAFFTYDVMTMRL